jgi:hypothetical protein
VGGDLVTRLTSIQAYEVLIKTGALVGQYAELQHLIATKGPGTACEILKGSRFDKNRNLARARFTELKERGLIVETEARPCSVTGRNALVWEATTRTAPLEEQRNKSATGKREILKIAMGLSHFTVHEERCNSITLGSRSGEGSDECDCGLADLESALKAVAL